MPETDLPLDALRPDPRNARRHDARNLALITEALQDVGAARSIVVDETGTVLAGNATLAAAGQAGLSRVRIVDADGTELIAVRLMDGERAACLWTDPPYGVSYVGKAADALTIANDDGAGLAGLLNAAFGNVGAHLIPGAAFYIAHPAGPLAQVFSQAVQDLGWSVRQSLVWVKDSLVLGRSDYHYRHEPLLFGYLPGPGRRGRGGTGWHGDHAQDSVFEVPRPKASPDHPTTKPVALVTAMLTNSTRRGDVVLDPFGGSGTTLISCAELGRSCRMLEIDPRYCDVVVGRWKALTGGTAERVAAPAEAA